MWISSLVVASLAFLGEVAAQSGSTTIGGLSGKHTNLPRWCGKPYQSGSPNYKPGGMLHPPAPKATPNLYIQVEPEQSIYDSTEKTAGFIVSAIVSYAHGEPFGNSPSEQPFQHLSFNIKSESTSTILLTDSVGVGSEKNVFPFDLTKLTPRLTPYDITLKGFSAETEGGSKTFTATTQLYYLPAKKTGSTVKVDNLNGGLIVKNAQSKYQFEPLLPFGFYASCSTYLNHSLANVEAYKDLGFNAINPVCAFTDGPLDFLLNWLDKTNLWFQYDMRGSYLNLTSVSEQIPLVKDHDAFLSWYTADEPDGWQYALNSTSLAYNLLREKDPYHPVSLVLNCDNYHFQDYSAGTDIIMEDAYPVGINATYSIPWNTPCNETYGDCGCDDCVGELTDVSDRLDSLYNYQEWLGRNQKSLWAVLQAFHGNYWKHDPTEQETWAMILLSFNHMAKGVMSWVFPPSKTLEAAHGKFAKVATVAPVSTILLGASPTKVTVDEFPMLDVAYWEVGSQVMVGIVNLDYHAIKQPVNITLEVPTTHIISQPWGSVSWSVKTIFSTSVLSTAGLEGLSTSLVILQSATQRWW